MNADLARTLKCVQRYRELGLCPLPAREDRKGPALDTFAEYYGPTPVPESVYENWRSPNIQLICGTKSPTPTKIVVMDIDGPEAKDVWHKITAANRYTPEDSWVSRTGGGGYHHWFRLPDGMESCPTGLLYGLWDSWGKNGEGGWVKHKEIRLLGDRALAVAPPSIHVDTGERYKFLGNYSPNQIPLPAVAPDWLLSLPRLTPPRLVEPPKRTPYVRHSSLSGSNYDRNEVLEAIGDFKLDVAKEWGLTFSSSRPSAQGWISCFVPWREDPSRSRPSGSFNLESGTFRDMKDLTTLTFFDLGVATGHHSTWQECADALGARFLGPRRRDVTWNKKTRH